MQGVGTHNTDKTENYFNFILRLHQNVEQNQSLRLSHCVVKVRHSSISFISTLIGFQGNAIKKMFPPLMRPSPPIKRVKCCICVLILN